MASGSSRDLRDATRGFPFTFAVKLQYRDIDTFIHPDYKNRADLKFVKRFSETRLSWDDFRRIKDSIDDAGFVSICTPFDETSVDRIEEHGYDYLKIPSCYLYRLASAGAHGEVRHARDLLDCGGFSQDIDKVVSFFRHRNRTISLMHCVGEYPTQDENLELNQIALLKVTLPGDRGRLFHPRTAGQLDAVKVAIGMGATLFEKHVGVPTRTAFKLNTYSANPAQVKRWLESAASGVHDVRRQGSAHASSAAQKSTACEGCSAACLPGAICPRAQNFARKTSSTRFQPSKARLSRTTLRNTPDFT